MVFLTVAFSPSSGEENRLKIEITMKFSETVVYYHYVVVAVTKINFSLEEKAI